MQPAVPQHQGKNPIRIAGRFGCPPAEPCAALNAIACETGRPNQGKTLQQKRNPVFFQAPTTKNLFLVAIKTLQL
jgi:hypothetical protein